MQKTFTALRLFLIFTFAVIPFFLRPGLGGVQLVIVFLTSCLVTSLPNYFKIKKEHEKLYVGGVFLSLLLGFAMLYKYVSYESEATCRDRKNDIVVTGDLKEEARKILDKYSISENDLDSICQNILWGMENKPHNVWTTKSTRDNYNYLRILQTFTVLFLSLGFSGFLILLELSIMRRKFMSTNLRCFIVHGHDKSMQLQLKDYLQNTLKCPEPTILEQQPNKGQTIIEKFERHAQSIDVAFVLLTPDDHGAAVGSDSSKSRVRQNVLFELGFFVGKFGRTSGRVILLYKGDLEIPSDLAGVIYIKISDRVCEAGEAIRRELKVLASRP